MSDSQKQRLVTAQELYEDLETYIAAGFTRKEAMQWMCRTTVTIQQVPMQYPPEMYEFWERQNALATRMSIQMEEDRDDD